MRSLTILRRAVFRLGLAAEPRRILELGAGDGTLLLRFARALQPCWRGVDLTLLDCQEVVSPSVRESFARLNWRVTLLRADALEWARCRPEQRYDLCVTTLFLHHFDDNDLSVLFKGVATRVDGLVACEPRRNGFSHLGSRLLGLLGANEVTREDGVKSVAAGFTGLELTRLWNGAVGSDWFTEEAPAWPFSHCFLASRHRALAPTPDYAR